MGENLNWCDDTSRISKRGNILGNVTDVLTAFEIVILSEEKNFFVL